MASRKTKRKSKSRRSASRPPENQSSGLLVIGLGALATIAVLGIVVVIAQAVWQPSPNNQDTGDIAGGPVAAETDSLVNTASNSASTSESNALEASDNRPASAPIGRVTYCQHNPNFTNGLEFGSVAIDTSRSRGQGLVLFDISAQDTFDANNIYQHETWDDAGDIGSYTLDEDGNIYVAPFPHVDLLENPPDQQNTLYRIDTETAVMEPFIPLDAPRVASTDNPFGIVAQTYDCETNSLYISSIAGSTRREELGTITQIDLQSGEIVAQLIGMDAYGLSIFKGTSGKRLYFGHARSGKVLSVPLESDGHFIGETRPEFSLAELYTAESLIARRISFREETMKVDAFRFHYNLAPLADSGPRPSFSFAYDDAGDSWTLVELRRNDF